MATGAFCPSCGSPTAVGARFCANCGTALHAASPSQPEPRPPGPSSRWDLPGADQGQPGVRSAARQGFGWALGCLLLGVVVVLAVMGLIWVGLTAATPSESSPDSSLAAPSAGPATGSATLAGTDDGTGPPFTLSRDDYVLTWAATSSGDAGSASPLIALDEDADGIAEAVPTG